MSSPDDCPAEEIHIAGLLVQTRAPDGPRVAEILSGLPGVELRAGDGECRWVVVCECAGEDDIVALIGRIRELPGVLNVALVYQHAESALAMEEEISDENDPP